MSAFDQQEEIARLRAIVADYERKSHRSKWLIRQLIKKIRNAPRDFVMRMKNSRRKRRERAALARAVRVHIAPAVQEIDPSVSTAVTLAPPPPASACAEPRPMFFHVAPGEVADLISILERDQASSLALAHMDRFCGSREMAALVAEAAAIDPEVGSLTGHEMGYLTPFQDTEYRAVRQAMDKIPGGEFDAVVLVPFGKLGGADLVGGVLATALAGLGRTLILRTDLPDWDRPDWYPPEAPAIDISGDLAMIHRRTRALYVILQQIAPRRIFNVNSRLAFDMMVEYGARLAVTSKLYSYYFCADRDPHGNEVGYPIWYFANILPHLQTAIFDTEYLVKVLTDRYELPAEMRARMRTVYTPARMPVRESVVEKQIASSVTRERPRILWGGRLDRQKRFDLVIELAQVMPDVQFDCWGKAVLDAPPDLSSLPKNMNMHPPFADYDELPLADADGWLYTAEWDGLPTILIELGTIGMPIVASAVGGVPELIDDTTGWLVSPSEGVAGYELAIRQMLADADGRRARTAALQARVAERHAPATYLRAIEEI